MGLGLHVRRDPSFLIHQLGEELCPYSLASAYEIASTFRVLMFRYYIREHVAPILAKHINLVLILIPLLHYYLWSIFIALESTTGMSVLEVTFSFLFVLIVTEAALLGISLFEYTATIRTACRANSDLTLRVLAPQLFHDLLGLVRHSQKVSSIIIGHVTLDRLFVNACHEHPRFGGHAP